MFALQRKFRIASMIETGVVPVGWIVAVFALLAATTVMCVIRFMTAKTTGRRVRERSVLVTIQACGFLVLAKQREFRGVVVKLGVGPLGRLMTRCAVVVHRILMRFVVAVTIDAVRRRLAMFLILGMTVAALGFEMCVE